MARFELPLSGNVSQTINPWTWIFSPGTVGQVGLFNFTIDLGPSSDPAIEAEIVRDVASYGKQIGRMQDVLAMLADRLDEKSLNDKERKALAAFRVLVGDVEAVKERRRKNAAA